MNIAIDFLNLKSIDKRYLVPTFLIHKNNISEYNIWLKKSPSKSQQKNLYSHQTAKFEQKKFKIAVASLCPYICVKDKVWTGYIHDLLISFAKIHNLKLEFIDTPTERLRHSLNKLEADMIISTSGNLRYFSDIQMFGKSLGVSYAGLMYKYNKSKNFYTSLEDLRQKNIGFSPPSFAQIKDEIVNLDFKTTNISGNNASSRLFKMFEVNRLDYIVDDYQILSYLSKNNKNYKIQAMSILGYNNLGLASMIENSEAKHFAFGFSNYIENLRRTGNLNRYLKKYAIKDWSEISFH